MVHRVLWDLNLHPNFCKAVFTAYSMLFGTISSLGSTHFIFKYGVDQSIAYCNIIMIFEVSVFLLVWAGKDRELGVAK